MLLLALLQLLLALLRNGERERRLLLLLRGPLALPVLRRHRRLLLQLLRLLEHERLLLVLLQGLQLQRLLRFQRHRRGCRCGRDAVELRLEPVSWRAIWKNDTLPYPDLYRDIPG